jgi:hypothetical protein
LDKFLEGIENKKRNIKPEFLKLLGKKKKQGKEKSKKEKKFRKN